MSRSTRNKRFQELKLIALRISECDDKTQAMRLLNGIRAGYRRSKELSNVKLKRIELIRELVDVYK